MRTLKMIMAGLAIVFASTMQAQISLHINVGTPPVWGPDVESNVRYYYLPDVNAYYDINTSMFIYVNDGRWTHRRHLPTEFRNYDLYRGRKVVVQNYRGNSPYAYCNYHAKRYDADRPERKNFKEHGHDERYSHEDGYRGNGKGHDKGRERRD